MKKIFKKNQIIITALAIMIAAAGYFNYADKNIIKSTGVSVRDEESDEYMDVSADFENELALGESEEDTENEEVNSEENSEENAEDTVAEEESEEPGTAVFTSSEVFATDARLNREQVRAKNEEALMEIINNAEIPGEQKQNAIDEMVKLADNAEKEESVEMLLEAEGFKNTVVSISDGQVDVVADMKDISDTDRAKIEEVITRKTGCEPENIVITPLN